MRMLACIFAFVICLSAHDAIAQGLLTPPGAPAPNMKTLAQVEPRMPISSLPYIITEGGSYYLTTNLTGVSGQYGILIQTNNVSIDLNGFTMKGVSGSLGGIGTPLTMILYKNISIHNGVCAGWGNSGVYGLYWDNATYKNLQCYSNRMNGIHVGNNSIVSDCVLMGNGTDGINAYEGNLIHHCVIRENGGDGIEVRSYNTVNDNVCMSNGGVSSGAGIRAARYDNVIKNNNVQLQPTGIILENYGNEISGNTVKGNTDNYNIAANNNVNILLCQIPETIDVPASVELAGSLSGVSGILITSDDVHIDLKGHCLDGNAAGSYGIYATGAVYNVSVCNGSLREWTGAAVDLRDADSCKAENLRAHDCDGDGLLFGENSVVSKCTAQFCNDGIAAGNSSVITECSAWENYGFGIEVVLGGIIKNCTARGNGEQGFRVGSSSTIENCTASENTIDGIIAGGLSLIKENNCSFNSGAGIKVTGDRNRIDSNSLNLNETGLDVDGWQNIVVRNSASGNSTDYAIAAGNSVGAIESVPGAIFTNSNPWANFRY